MITPIRIMTINQIMKRKDDLLVSVDDIKELAKEERNKAIDDFRDKICEKYTAEERKENYKQYCCNIKQELVDLAEQLKR